MEIDYKKLMSSKSEEGLLLYINQSERYTEEAVLGAIKELKNRGRQFSDAELEDIQLRLEAQKKKRTDEDARSNSWKKNIVTDPEAPQLYTPQTIYIFSMVFTVVFGAALLASNIKDHKKGRWLVLSFGIFYTGLMIFLLSFIPRNTGLTIAANGIGAWILNQFLWNTFIGKDTQYRKKPIWKALIISILIAIPFLFAIIYEEFM